MPRNYRKEYDNYHKKKKQKKRRALRNKARRAALRSGKVKKGDKKDIHHKGSLKRHKNVTVKSRSANRSFPRTRKARKKKG